MGFTRSTGAATGADIVNVAGLEFLERELRDLPIEAFRGAPELSAAQPGKLQLQRVDLEFARHQLCALFAQHPLQSLDIARQIVAAWHTCILPVQAARPCRQRSSRTCWRTSRSTDGAGFGR